jgi:glycosyltransferase involved in cell wall biosynthesis
MKTTLVIPTLNEIDGMKAIMPKIKREWVDQILIVDGGSTDGTIEYAKENNYEIMVQKTKGIGNGYREALPLVKGDVIITFSPDGNSVPEGIPQLVDKMKEGYDLVIASRYKDDAKSYDDDIFTKIGNKLFTSSINLLFGGKYTDTLVIFRAYKKSIIEELKIDAPHLTFEFQISIRAAQKKLRIGEIPGDEPKRIGGERKMKPLHTGYTLILEMFKNFLFPKVK